MADSDRTPYTPPPVQDRASKPPGILPRNMQARIIGGIALLMVLVIAYSGRNPPKERSASTPPGMSAVVDPNEARIQEYRARIEEQARRLAAEQTDLARARRTPGAPASSRETPGGASSVPLSPGSPSYSGQEQERDSIKADRLKREYQSLFASNLALTYRNDRAPQSTVDSGDNDARAKAGPPERTGAASGRGTDETNANGKEYRLFEGTVIETVLTNRLDGSFSGPVNCLVTTHVYSHDRRKLLIPQGSRALGEVSHVETFGQQRLAVAFHRLIMPDGYAVSLEKLPGLNQIGETGLVDQVNRHYLQVFGVSLAIGAIAGLTQANTTYGLERSAADAYRQGVASSLSQSSLNILDRYLNVLPTFTIREGHRVKIYLTGDLLLPAYDEHRMPADL